MQRSKPSMPAVIAHCDWSKDPKKRWMTVAIRSGDCWAAYAPEPVGVTVDLLDRLEMRAIELGPLFVGFDFPIGLPLQYALRTGFKNFREALKHFGDGQWAQWFIVANDATEVSLRRPFYPQRPNGKKGADLIQRLGVAKMEELLRVCERRTSNRLAASSLFWTLGASQVGKATISGWREVIKPSVLTDRISLWPFDGTLSEVFGKGKPVVAETYPGETYVQIGIPNRRTGSEKKRGGRLSASPYLNDWLGHRPVVPEPQLCAAIADGFGDAACSEDQFDAVVGLFGMIDVAIGVRTDGVPEDEDIRRWEGWILGQSQGVGCTYLPGWGTPRQSWAPHMVCRGT